MQPHVRQSVPTFLDISRFSSLLFFASSLRKNTSVWYGAAIRGDVNKVVIGENTNIGDRSVVHVAKIQGDYPTFIGDNVTVGPGAIIHAATLQSNCMVGAGAQVLDGAVIESLAIIAPGAVVTPKTVVPMKQLWAGSPAKVNKPPKNYYSLQFFLGGVLE